MPHKNSILRRFFSERFLVDQRNKTVWFKRRSTKLSWHTHNKFDPFFRSTLYSFCTVLAPLTRCRTVGVPR